MKFILVFLLSLTGFVQATAATTDCSSFLNPKNNKSILTDADIAKAYKIGRDKSTFDEDFWEGILNIYLERRVQQLPEELQSTAREVLDKSRIIYKKYPRSGPNTRYLVMPEYLRSTPIPYVILAHEWEHYIRNIIKTHGKYIDGSMSTALNPAALYKEEANAMRAEWELARFITDEEAAEILETIQYDSWESRRAKMVYSNMAKFRNLSSFEYVEAHQKSGRYSFFNSLQKVIKKNSTLIALIAAPTIAVTFWHNCIDSMINFFN